jgi:F-type H+-transporting ATPase subunit delta
MYQVERRYAAGLLATASGNAEADAISEELRQFTEVMAHPDLESFFHNPEIPSKAKHEVAKKLAPDAISPTYRKFLGLLVDKHRVTAIPGIYREYKHLLSESRNELTLVVTSARPLAPAQIDKLRAAYQKKYGTKAVQVETKVDPSLWGGLRVQIGDILTDDTLSTRLRHLGRALYGK